MKCRTENCMQELACSMCLGCLTHCGCGKTFIPSPAPIGSYDPKDRSIPVEVEHPGMQSNYMAYLERQRYRTAQYEQEMMKLKDAGADYSGNEQWARWMRRFGRSR